MGQVLHLSATTTEALVADAAMELSMELFCHGLPGLI